MRSLSLVNKSFKDTPACISPVQVLQQEIKRLFLNEFCKATRWQKLIFHFRKCRFRDDNERNSAKPLSFIFRDVTRTLLPFGQTARYLKYLDLERTVPRRLSNKRHYLSLYLTKYWGTVSTLRGWAAPVIPVQPQENSCSIASHLNQTFSPSDRAHKLSEKSIYFHLSLISAVWCRCPNALEKYLTTVPNIAHTSRRYKFKLISHFRVPLRLCFKASLSAKPFLWKWLWFCMKMKLRAELIFIRKVSHLDSFWNRGTRELGNGLFISYH